jgi:hypothetical protein
VPNVDERLATCDEVLLGELRIVGAPHPPGGRYVERYWLPTLGPSATFALRRLAPLASAVGDGPPVAVALECLAGELGLGSSAGRNARVRGALERLVRFRLACHGTGGRLLVATAVPPLTEAAVAHLPRHLQEVHPRA